MYNMVKNEQFRVILLHQSVSACLALNKSTGQRLQNCKAELFSAATVVHPWKYDVSERNILKKNSPLKFQTSLYPVENPCIAKHKYSDCEIEISVQKSLFAFE